MSYIFMPLQSYEKKDEIVAKAKDQTSDVFSPETAYILLFKSTENKNVFNTQTSVLGTRRNPGHVVPLGYVFYTLDDQDASMVFLEWVYAPGFGKMFIGLLLEKFRLEQYRKVVLNVSIDPSEMDQDNVKRRINFWFGQGFRVINDIKYREEFGPLLTLNPNLNLRIEITISTSTPTTTEIELTMTNLLDFLLEKENEFNLLIPQYIKHLDNRQDGLCGSLEALCLRKKFKKSNEKYYKALLRDRQIFDSFISWLCYGEQFSPFYKTIDGKTKTLGTLGFFYAEKTHYDVDSEDENHDNNQEEGEDKDPKKELRKVYKLEMRIEQKDTKTEKNREFTHYCLYFPQTGDIFHFPSQLVETTGFNEKKMEPGFRKSDDSLFDHVESGISDILKDQFQHCLLKNVEILYTKTLFDCNDAQKRIEILKSIE